MAKRIIIIHGWGASPGEDWFPWLRKELESRGFEVIIPEMPDTERPKIKPWVSKISEIVGKPDEDTYFIGHSIGCQAILRYLQTLTGGSKVGGVIFVAGWLNLTDETWDEDYTREIADPWINTKIDFEKIKNHSNKFVEIASDNDLYVPLSDVNIFKEKLNAEIIVEHEKGHFSVDAGVKELPVVLDKLLKMAEEK